MNLYEFATQPGPIDMRPYYETEKSCSNSDYCEHAAMAASDKEYPLVGYPHEESGHSVALFSLLAEQRLTENEFRMLCLFAVFAAKEH